MNITISIKCLHIIIVTYLLLKRAERHEIEPRAVPDTIYQYCLPFTVPVHLLVYQSFAQAIGPWR